ncbi:hypothetical protein ABH915_002816 [Arthrobacter sp. MW3 TE3886]
MDSNLRSLNDETTGSYAVRTGSGTLYAIHLDPPREVVRLAKDRNPTSPYDELPAAELRRDGEAIKLLNVIEMRVGRRGLMLLDLRLDGIPTLRGTTEVLSISRLQGNWPHGAHIEFH